PGEASLDLLESNRIPSLPAGGIRVVHPAPGTSIMAVGNEGRLFLEHDPISYQAPHVLRGRLPACGIALGRADANQANPYPLTIDECLERLPINDADRTSYDRCRPGGDGQIRRDQHRILCDRRRG